MNGFSNENSNDASNKHSEDCKSNLLDRVTLQDGVEVICSHVCVEKSLLRTTLPRSHEAVSEQLNDPSDSTPSENVREDEVYMLKQ